MSVLRRCTIENIGLIARTEFTLSDGLTVFTGETGSGKTMLLSALQLALGERASPDLVGRDGPSARVALEIEPDAALRSRLIEEAFPIEGDEDAVFVRELQREGKSSARINGRPATAAQLRAYGELLVDFVGQHEQQRLLSAPYHGELLDRFAGDATVAQRDHVGSLHRELTKLGEDVRTLDESSGRALAEAEFARFAASEIQAARLSESEESELRERRAFLANAERIAESLHRAHEALAGGETSAADALGMASAALASVSKLGHSLGLLGERAAALQSDATELALAVTRAVQLAEFNPAELDEISARLDAVERLKKKYGATVADVIAAGDRFAAQARAYDARDEQREALRRRQGDCATELTAAATALTALRQAAAATLEERVAGELTALGMKHARFAVLLEPLEAAGPRGREQIIFALAPNRGEELRPIAAAASGGELSRVLLALVVVMSDRRDRASLVFDEIDAGIGGATAQAVALRLGALARIAQVLCITHLAQIASWADAHIALRKRELRAGTRIDAAVLEPGEVRGEIARMLSGKATGVALDHAETLLRDVGRQKKPALRTA
ncbi:MAG: DNA repair protein RecN [Candidatus Eremiobacteraeota bacterium]|nr:DNA repair protein RecN [Candidatus Eremiobacteraeota bacterium]MBV9647826.1 DNA repair protein RecN [Candidatus Eremiobacteraeota bacterium]